VKYLFGIFGLQPDAVMARVRASGRARVPSLAQTIVTSTVGFTVASLVVYGSWALHGRALYRHLSEPGAYAVWAAVFILLAGGLLNPTVIGPKSLGRFYALFGVGFAAYAVLWSASWFGLGGKLGEWMGSFVGTTALALVLAGGFGLKSGIWRIIAGLFVLHSAGYFAGSALYDFFRGANEQHWLNEYMSRPTRRWVAMLSWGFAHGIGLGAGLGYALFTCQSGIRELLGNSVTPAPAPASVR
jgi:hypothetical protein